MATILTRCTKCGKAYRIDEKLVNKGLKCKSCGKLFRIKPEPGPEMEVVVSSPSPPGELETPGKGSRAYLVAAGSPIRRMTCPSCKAVINVDTSAAGRKFFCARCKTQVYPPKPGGYGAENQIYWTCRKCSHEMLVTVRSPRDLEAVCEKCSHANVIPKTRSAPVYEAWSAAEKQRENEARAAGKAKPPEAAAGRGGPGGASSPGGPAVRGAHTAGPGTRSKMAIASLALGIAGVPTLGLASLVGLVLGILSLYDIRKSAGRLSGRRMAIAGIAVSAAATVVGGLLAAVIIVRFRPGASAPTKKMTLGGDRAIMVACGEEGCGGMSGRVCAWRGQGT
jgi:DNA-directed RNA polymerase subunit RPC12/RpoP